MRREAVSKLFSGEKGFEARQGNFDTERRSERGSALAAVLMTMMLLVSLGMAALTVSMSASSLSREAARFEQAYYTAESALQTAMGRLRSPASPVDAALNGAASIAELRSYADAAARDASRLVTGGMTAVVTIACSRGQGLIRAELRSSCGGRVVLTELEFTAEGCRVVSYREIEGDDI